MTEQEIKGLLIRYQQGQCTKEEQLWLHTYFDQLHANATSLQDCTDYEEASKKIWLKLQATNGPTRPLLTVKFISAWTMAGAAAILIALIFYFFYKPQKPINLYAYNKAHDVPAGTNKATLTLSNGKQINLDDATSGTIVRQNGISITKNTNGQIIYEISDQSGSAEDAEGTAGQPQYNIITTPNGGQYQVILPDGSKVQLNAASSLKYPLTYTSNERRVNLTGEGYFQVAKDPAQPFIVETETQIVKVLGTHFNVNAYGDEKLVKTTLVEGKVSVSLFSKITPSSPSNTQQTLTPGLQAVNNGTKLTTQTVDINDEIAWKDGLFVFRNSSIRVVMRQLSRWYNVTVDYNQLQDEPFEGEINRDEPLSELLKVIEKTNHVKLKIEGRKITVIN